MPALTLIHDAGCSPDTALCLGIRHPPHVLVSKPPPRPKACTQGAVVAVLAMTSLTLHSKLPAHTSIGCWRARPRRTHAPYPIPSQDPALPCRAH